MRGAVLPRFVGLIGGSDPGLHTDAGTMTSIILARSRSISPRDQCFGGGNVGVHVLSSRGICVDVAFPIGVLVL